MNVIAQIFGILAFIFSVLSFQLKRYRGVMIAQIICAFFFTVHFLMLFSLGESDALTGGVLNGFCVIRNIILLLTEKRRDKRGTAILAAVFSLGIVVLGIISWSSWISLIFIIAMVLNTIGLSMPNPQHVRMLILVSAPFACVYDILNQSLGGSINEMVSFLSALIGLIRYRNKQE